MTDYVCTSLFHVDEHGVYLRCAGGREHDLHPTALHTDEGGRFTWDSAQESGRWSSRPETERLRAHLHTITDTPHTCDEGSDGCAACVAEYALTLEQSDR